MIALQHVEWWQEAATGLSDAIDRNTPAEVPCRCQVAPSIASVERTLSLAHRLSYTSFAPPGEFQYQYRYQ